ncbi:hypothetical protein GCM10010524_70910 [Streptomyces mexicanus]
MGLGGLPHDRPGRKLDADESLGDPEPVHDVLGPQVPGVGVVELRRLAERGAFGLGPDLDEPLQQRRPFRAPGLRQGVLLPLLFSALR